MITYKIHDCTLYLIVPFTVLYLCIYYAYSIHDCSYSGYQGLRIIIRVLYAYVHVIILLFCRYYWDHATESTGNADSAKDKLAHYYIASYNNHTWFLNTGA